MRKPSYFLRSCLPLGLLFCLLWISVPALAQEAESAPQTQAKAPEKVDWISFEEAQKRNLKDPRRIIIDVYTDWCGWCKKMDKATFENPEIVKIMGKYFHAVKLNAEQRDPIMVGDSSYQFIPSGTRGYHSLATSLMNNKMRFPTMVFLDEHFNMIQPLGGYHGPEEMNPILRYLGSGAYKTTPYPEWEEAAGAKPAE